MGPPFWLYLGTRTLDNCPVGLNCVLNLPPEKMATKQVHQNLISLKERPDFIFEYSAGRGAAVSYTHLTLPTILRV